jgi:lysophospholipase L1-like esterase/chitodextrinase
MLGRLLRDYLRACGVDSDRTNAEFNGTSSREHAVIEPLEGRTLLASGTGLAGAYFARTNHTLAKFSRTDARIDLAWPGGTPHHKLGTDGFSVRWTGQVLPKFSEYYTFIARASGGLRLWVNNHLVISDWSQHSLRESRGRLIRLTGGKRFDIRIDYWSNGGDSPQMRLEWEGTRRTREIIPTNRLFAASLDNAAPSMPPQLHVASVTDQTASIEWNPSSDPSGVVAYDIFVGETKVLSSYPKVMSYVRGGLEPQTGYVFSVQAIDAAGNVSTKASTATVTSEPSDAPPTAPANVRVTGLTTDSITLDWSASTDDSEVDGYRIYRNGTQVGSSVVTGFTDDGLSPGSTHTYNVRAVDDSSQLSPSSNSAVATTAQPTPVDPYDGFGAAEYDGQSGITLNGSDLNSLDDGDWIRFSDVDFGSGANSVQMQLALPASNRGGRIEFRIGDPDGALVGTHVVQATGSWGTYFTQHTSISGLNGERDLYVVFKGRSGVANLRSITFSTQRLTRIMALGDSITAGVGGSPGYRYYLWHRLRDAGHRVDFVGAETLATNGANPPNFDFDQNHEGHPGWRADQIADSAAGWASQHRPDIVLLHVGSNDVHEGQSASSTIDDIEDTIDALRSVLPNVKILLAKIIPYDGLEDEVDDLNDRIPGLAASLTTSSSPIIVVDQHSGFNVSSDSLDGVHPNSSGDSKIANRWYDELVDLL